MLTCLRNSVAGTSILHERKFSFQIESENEPETFLEKWYTCRSQSRAPTR